MFCEFALCSKQHLSVCERDFNFVSLIGRRRLEGRNVIRSVYLALELLLMLLLVISNRLISSDAPVQSQPDTYQQIPPT